jgi:lysophospholipase L1-like esterase
MTLRSANVMLGLWMVVVCAAAVVAEEKKPAPAWPPVDAVECRPRGGMPNVLAKLAAGQEVRIAYFGGSITAQAGWRVKTLKWFQEQYPKAKVSEINAAIGGTGSDLGVFRLGQDVLMHKPDLVFVEFAVNDSGAVPEDIVRAIEGIVRQIWKADPTTDICFVYTITQAIVPPMFEGKFPRAASVMEAVADHYAIPSIHMAMEVARMAKEGKLLWAEKLPKTDDQKKAVGDNFVFAPDGVHPHPETGHELYLAAVVRSMPAIQAAGKPGPHPLPAPLAADNWENAKMVPLSAVKPADGWQRLDPEKDRMAKQWTSRMPEFWKAEKAPASITFKFRGTACAIYDLLGPDCGQVTMTLDDKPPVVRPRFDRYCTYHRLATLQIGRNLPDAVHAVKLELHPEPPDKVKIFIDGKQTAENPKDNPKYKGTNWYAGAILIVGDLVE